MPGVAEIKSPHPPLSHHTLRFGKSGREHLAGETPASCHHADPAAEPEILNKGGRADTLYYT